MGTAARPPQILQIYREPLKPGSEAAYQAIEEETARIAAALGCPHPYLGAESLTGPQEVWWFNGYESAAEQKEVYEAYASNARLTEALQRNSKRKASLTLESIETFATYRRDLSVGAPWILGHGRFLVITMTTRPQSRGTVFEAPDGRRFIVTSAKTPEEADAARSVAGSEANIYAVRPGWSFPAKEWVAADPLFWQGAGELVEPEESCRQPISPRAGPIRYMRHRFAWFSFYREAKWMIVLYVLLPLLAVLLSIGLPGLWRFFAY
jgi:hypothetical protein